MTILIVVILLVFGFALLTVEAMAPGVHIFGITGGILVLGGIALATVAMGPVWGAVTFMVSVLIFSVVLVVSIKSGTWKRMTLVTEQRKDAGYRSDNVTLSRFLGKRGKVLHDLRPVGYIEIGGERVEAVSESDFVNKGEPVEAVRLDGARLVVRPVLGAATDEQSEVGAEGREA